MPVSGSPATARSADRYYTLPEAAARLKISPRTLQRWVSDRVIETVRVGRFLKFRHAALEQCERQRTVVIPAQDRVVVVPARKR